MSRSNDYLGINAGMTKDMMPAIQLTWGKLKTTLPPEKVREHAISLMEAAACAEMDAAILRWAGSVLGLPPEQGIAFVAAIQKARETGEIPSCTLNLGDESITPDQARARAAYLLANSFIAESEAVLSVILLDGLGFDAERLSLVIEDLRKIRGLKTDWDREGLK